MDGGGNKDTSNFFNRIKNVDVLRSPFPRHLVQSNRVPAMASSMRPIISNAPVTHNAMRPAPLRTVPAWQSPVPQPGNFNISPVGGHGRGSTFGQVLPSSTVYRPPAEYPSSVQPLHTRSYPTNDVRQMPESTFPAHRRRDVRGIPANPPHCLLRNWYVCVDVEKMAVTVSGSFTKPNGTTVARYSSPIDIAFDERVVAASSGTVYQLVDLPDLEMMRTKGLPPYLIPSFTEGFPRNWKKLVDEYLVVAAGALRRGGAAPRGDVSTRPAYAPLASGYMHDDHRYAGPTGTRFQPILEEGGPVSISPISPPSSVSIGSIAPERQRRSPSVGSTGHQGGTRSSVYRSGLDIFASNRFARKGSAHAADQPEERRTDLIQPPRSGSQVTDITEATEQCDEDNAGVRVTEMYGLSRDQSPAERVDRLSASYLNMPADTPTKQPVSRHSPSLSPELGPSQTKFSWNSADDHRHIDDDLEPFKLDSGVDEDADEPVLETEREHSSVSSTTDLEAAARILTIDHPKVAKKTPRVMRKVIDSSDESQGAAENDTSSEQTESLAQTSAGDEAVGETRVTKSALASRVARKASRVTPAKPRVARAPRSAPAGRARPPTGSTTKRTARKTPKPHSDADSTPTKVSAKRGKWWSEDWDMEPLVIIERVAKRSDRVSQLESTESRDVDKDMGGDADGDADSSEKPGPASSKKTTYQTPKRTTTPKRKAGGQGFQYREPKVTSSVTRSGRKVRRPQEWWTNACEHLGNTHQESDIKYRWGKGDAFVVRDGKRIRLSDFVMGNEDGESVSSNHTESDS
ncbi:hypothetical protein IW147_003493 [Coemansia sp. RSA 720]|nr:hypothetical protein IW147_003493 [Coemansia sp. RSA 720]